MMAMRFLVRVSRKEDESWRIYNLAFFSDSSDAADYAQTMLRRAKRVHGKNGPPRRFHVIDVGERVCFQTLSYNCEDDNTTAFPDSLPIFLRLFSQWLQRISIESSPPPTEERKTA